MKKILGTAFLMAILLIAPMGKSIASSEPLLAEVTIFAGNYAPRGWAYCEGQVLKISQNQALFSLMGTTYGGDGRTTFALPNLTNVEKTLQGARYIIALEGIYPSRN